MQAPSLPYCPFRVEVNAVNAEVNAVNAAPNLGETTTDIILISEGCEFDH